MVSLMIVHAGRDQSRPATDKAPLALSTATEPEKTDGGQGYEPTDTLTVEITCPEPPPGPTPHPAIIRGIAASGDVTDEAVMA